MILQNRNIRAIFCDRTGALLQIEDKLRNFCHLNAIEDTDPFHVERAGRMLKAYRDFHWERDEDSLQLYWTLTGAVLHASVGLLEDGLHFEFMLDGPKAYLYQAVEYPIIEGLTSHGDSSFLAHAYATGLLMRNPASFLPRTGGLRFCPYPESFSGASMQLMAYYHPGFGGLYLAAEDGAAHQKWLNAYAKKGQLGLSHMFGFEDVRGQGGIRQPYPFVLRLFDGNRWEEAAEMYRIFALTQPWCIKGRLADRRRNDDWLHEEVGYCTFGINAAHDRSHWLRRYRQDIGQNGFHVLGPDWTNKPQTFGSGVPGGYADWLPTRFDANTLRTIAQNGDRFAPFEFDFLVALNQSDTERLKDNLQSFPKPSLSHDGYRFNMLCPCQPFTQSFHCDRDVQVQRESECDAMYYDISANNLIKICMREDHAHRPGGGIELTGGYQTTYRETADALSKQARRTIPLGTEMMCEVFLREIDYYQARSWAQPCSTLETWPFRVQMISGQARMIPMFDYVYHEFGVVRMDGWGKLVEETGELYYYNVAKIYLWGGLYELNYEYSPMEELDGQENTGEEHYFTFDPQHCAYSPGRAAYLKVFAAARTGDAKPYWVYGRLLATPSIEVPQKEYSWYHYNHDQKSPSYRASGLYSAPAVVLSLFKDAQGTLACFMANADEKEHVIRFSLEDIMPGLSGAGLILYRFDTEGCARMEKDFSMQSGEVRLLPLQARTLYMLEIIRNERGTTK